MASPPYFAFYPKDFSADHLVESMTTLQVGAYILLLCKAWQADPPASLPADDAVLARLARLSPAEWSAAKAAVLAPFKLGSDNRYHQKRLRQEHGRAVAVRKARAEAGRKGGRPKKVRDGPPPEKANGLALLKQTQSKTLSDSGSNSDSSSGKRGQGGKGPAPPDGFADFWAAYPRKVARKAAAEAWARLAPDEALRGRILAAVEAQKRSPGWLKDGGQYVPHPATWLNKHRWEDEVGPPAPARSAVQQAFDEAQRREARCRANGSPGPSGTAPSSA
jgi:uncharacterized protein YdaU (DUF1376 family)